MNLSFTKDYFFYTIQGEGAHTGVPSIFLRLSACNLRCEWKNPDGSISLCDTPYSSHQPEKLIKTIDQVLDDIKDIDCKYIVITGGEPYLQKNLVELIRCLKEKDYYICVETNATIYLPTQADFISMSPKLSSSCVSTSANYQSHQEKRLNIEAISQFIEKHDYQLKFVVNQEDELNEIQQILEELKDRGLVVPVSKVLLMPQAVSKDQLEQRSLQVVEWAKKYDFRFCDRLHVRLWGDKRGV